MIFIVIIATSLCFLYFYLVSVKAHKIPPGLKEIPLVKGVPFFGILNQAKPTWHHYFITLAKFHGPIFRVYCGMREMIILNDLNSIKKSLKENADNFSGRLRMKGYEVLTLNSGILFTEGNKWAKQRSFVLKVLRDFGLGKSKSASIIQNECIFLLDELEKNEGKCVDFSNMIQVYTSNIISKFIMNKRFTREDSKLDTIESVVNENAKTKNPFDLLHILLPILDGVGFIMRFTLLKQYTKVYDIFQLELKEHLDKLDFSSEGEDLIDRFLIEQNRMKLKTGFVDTFTDWQLIRNSYDLFVAGYETTSTLLGWSMMFMSKHPHIQDKVHHEIIDQIGLERLTTMNDKKSLNYTQAVMDEILRWSSVVPLALPHRNFYDCDINGYFIPKDSVIIPNLFACHFDPKVWEKPDQFYPGHFLQIDNDGQMKYNPREDLIPFSMGKRQCLGESLTRMEYFIFFTSILQRFRVRFVEELSEKQYQEVLIGNNADVRVSSVKNFIFERLS